MRNLAPRLTLLLPLVAFAACSSEAEDPDGTAGSAASAGNAGQPSGGRGGAGGSGGGGAGSSGSAQVGGKSGSSGAGTGGTGTAGSGNTTGGTAGQGGAGAGSGGKAGAAGAAGSVNGGAGGTGGTTPGLDSCPAPPAGVPEASILALNTENEIRLAMGLECAELVPELITAAQNHCDYYVTNQGDPECEAASPHSEVEGCPGYTGEGLGERFSAAGYTIRGSGNECMAFTNDPVRSTMMFVDSVYHRTPVLDPWIRHLGYGSGEGCDTIDYGTGPMTPNDVTAFYPYADQTNVPTSFDGSREGPEPPEPSSGWPSGYPVTLYARNITVQSHTIMVDGTTADLPHQWLAEDDDTLPSYARVLYTDEPLEPNTTYRVTIEATGDAGAVTFDWKFTTGAGGRR